MIFKILSSIINYMIKEKDLKYICKGAVEIIHKKELLEKLNSGKKLIVKHGIDPTAPDLHLGHSVNYIVMRRFQELGHKVIILFGDFTGRIGDPTDKLSPRKGMTKLQIEKNIKKIKPQILKILHKKNLEFKRNSEWWDKMNLEKFLNIAKFVSATHLFERDMFKKRIKLSRPVWVHEFLYPILQGYDSVMLKADLTVIGEDQKFNELIGRKLQQIFNQTPQSLVLMPILIGLDGKEKMGKSLKNYISVDENPIDMFGKIMSMPDSNILHYYELLTDTKPEQFSKIKKEIKNNPKETKMSLAWLITKLYHNKKSADKAKKYFIETFIKKKLPKKIKKFILKKQKINIVDLLIDTKLAKSKTEAKRLIKEGAIKINKEKIKDKDFTISKNALPLILQKGKKSFLKITKG